MTRGGGSGRRVLGAAVALAGVLVAFGAGVIGWVMLILAGANATWATAGAAVVAALWPIGFGFGLIAAGVLLMAEKDLSKDHPREGAG